MVPAPVAGVNPKIRHPADRPLRRIGAALAAKHDMFNFSAPNLIGGFIFGSIGFVAFIYGKRMTLWKPMFCGIALMAFPYFVENTMAMLAIGCAGTIALFFLRN
jgi:hypothetical protein